MSTTSINSLDQLKQPESVLFAASKTTNDITTNSTPDTTPLADQTTKSPLDNFIAFLANNPIYILIAIASFILILLVGLLIYFCLNRKLKPKHTEISGPHIVLSALPPQYYGNAIESIGSELHSAEYGQCIAENPATELHQYFKNVNGHATIMDTCGTLRRSESFNTDSVIFDLYQDDSIMGSTKSSSGSLHIFESQQVNSRSYE